MIKEFFKKLKWENIIVSLLAIALGIVCIAMPNPVSNAMCIVFGTFLIVIGCSLLVKYFAFDRFIGASALILSITTITLGIFCLVYPSSLQEILTVLFGLFIVISSISSLCDSLYLAKAKQKGWFILFLLSLITCILGIIVMFGTFETITLFAGISLIIDGAESLILTIIYSYRIKKAKKQLFSLTNQIELDENDYTTL